MKHAMLFVLAALPFVVLSANTSTASTNVQREITTAISNANYVNDAKYVKQAHLYLQHVVNCLVGTRSDEFVANAGDPCIGAGRGAINDYKGDKLDKALLTRALQDAEYGLVTNNIQIAQSAANLSKKSLQEARQTL